ncbi:MAG TPA: sterol desaturase family protein [Terriglobales bacterium]|nr:sterol desaturase family protein [Terriglobales bacterium]
MAILIAACAVLSSVEAVVPLFQYRRGRLRRAVPNLILAVGVVLTNVACASMTASLSAFVVREHFGLFGGMRSHPSLLLVMGVAALDLCAYFAHLLLHKMRWGWKFHRVHHSELEVDVTTAFRQHPGETLWRVLWQAFGIALFGLPFWVVPLYLSVSSLNALLEHANVRMSNGFDGWLRMLIVTPNMHKIHHSRLVIETDSNYSNIFSLWDRLFCTHTQEVNYRGLRYGLDGFDQSREQNLTALIGAPFRTS